MKRKPFKIDIETIAAFIICYAVFWFTYTVILGLVLVPHTGNIVNESFSERYLGYGVVDTYSTFDVEYNDFSDEVIAHYQMSRIMEKIAPCLSLLTIIIGYIIIKIKASK